MYLKIYSFAVILFVSIDGCLSQCTPDKLSSASACGTQFSNGLLSLSKAVLNQTVPLSQVCTRLEEHYNKSLQCFSQYRTECDSHAGFVLIEQAVQNGYGQFAGVYRCTGTSSSSCGMSIQSAIQECTLQFSTKLQALQNSLSSGTLTPQVLQTYCQSVQATMVQTEQCLNTAVGGRAACNFLLEAQRATLTQTAEFLSQSCGSAAGKCGPLAMASCLYNMSSINMSSNVDSLCRVIPGLMKCLDGYKAQCGEIDYQKQIEEQGVKPLLDVSKMMCSPGCKGKIPQMEQCIQSLPTVSTYTYKNICGHLERIVKCVSASTGNCTFMEEMFKPQLPGILQAVSMYGCNITVGSHVYKPKGCDLQKMTSCYNPVLQTLGLPKVTRDSDLKQIYTELYSSSLITNTATYPQSCSQLNAANVDMEAVGTCVLDEFFKCPIDFLMSMNEYGKWRNKTAPEIPSMIPHKSTSSFDLGDTLSREELAASTGVFQMLDGVDKLMHIHCTNCTNATERITAMFTCSGSQTNFKITGETAIREKMTSVVSKFNNRQDYTADCSLLKEVAACANKYMGGCRITEYAVTELIDKPEIYPAFDLCGIKFNFKLQEKLLGCDNINFVKRQEEMLHRTCKPTFITEDDIPWAMTQQRVCNIIQEQIHCYARNAHCCQTRKEVLEPMMHNWGMLNTLLGCSPSLLLQTDSNPSGIDMRSIDTGCDYQGVLGCYNPILKKVGIDTNTLGTPITPQVFMKMLKLKSTILNNPSLCIHRSEFSVLERCVKQMTQKCKYTSTCDKTMVNQTPKTDSLGMLPLADMLDLKSIKSICSQDCMSASFSSNSYKDCHIDKLVETSSNVAWNDLTGVSTTEYCSEMKKVSDCIVPKLGRCEYRIKELHAKLNLDSDITKEAITKCNVKFSPVIQTTASPPSTPITTVSGAGHVLSTVVLLISTFLISALLL